MALGDKYREWEKNKRSESEDGTVSSLGDKYLQWEWENHGDELMNDFQAHLTNYTNSYNAYYDSYNKRFSGRKGTYEDSYVSDSGDWLEESKRQISGLEAERDYLDKFVLQYGKYMGIDYTSDVNKMLSGLSTNYNQMMRVAEQDNTYWNKFADEEAYKAFQAIESERTANKQALDNYNPEEEQQKLAILQEQYDALKNVMANYGMGGSEEDGRIMDERKRLEESYGMTMSEIKAAIKEKRRFIKDAENYHKYKDITQEKDFLASSAFSEAFAAEDGVYNFINSVNGEDITSDAEAQKVVDEYLSSLDSVGDLLYINLTEDEKKIYNYLYAKQGRQEAMEYLKTLGEELSAREGAKIYENLSGIEKAFYWAKAGLDQFGEGVASLFSSEARPTSPVQYASAMVREDAYDTWEGLGYLYDAGVTVGNMLPSIAVSFINPTAGAVTMGASASGNAYNQALKEGYSKREAAAYGLLVGVSETCLQRVLGGISSMGGKGNLASRMMSKVSMIDKSLLRISAKYGIALSGEIIEEELQLLLEPAFKSIIMGEDYDLPTINEMLETAIVTALSTGALESTSIISGEVTTRAKGKEIASAQNGVKDLIDFSQEIKGADPQTTARASELAQKTATKKGRDNHYIIGELYKTTGEMVAQSNKASITKSLEESGLSKNEADDVANAIIAAYNGEKLTRKQRKLLQSVDSEAAVHQEAAIANETKDKYKALIKQGGTDTDIQRPASHEEPITAEEKLQKAWAEMDQEETSPEMQELLELSKQYGEGAQEMVQAYREGQNVQMYNNGYRAAYSMGREGVNREYAMNATSAGIAYLTDEQRMLAYEAGRAVATEAVNQSEVMEEVDNGKERAKRKGVHLRHGVQRSDGQSAGGKVRSVEKGTGAVQVRQEATARERTADGTGTDEATQEAEALGLPKGSSMGKVRLYTGAGDAHTDKAQALGKKYGVQLVLFEGDNILIPDPETGKRVPVRAYIQNGVAYVRADHKVFKADQLMRHEITHARIARGEINVEKVYNRLVDLYKSEEVVLAVLQKYAEAYSMLDYSALQVMEEIVCDSEAEMNAFAPKDQKSAERFLENTRRLTSETTSDPQNRGPPADTEGKFSKETRKVKTFLRHFSGAVNEGEYIYLSNIEKATIKSNIKTGFGHLAPDAKRGIVSAHDISKGYTYRFVCNADYSVTVIDVFDDVADRAIIDRLLKEVTGHDSAGVRQSGKPAGTEGVRQSDRSNDGSTYEKAKPGKSTAEVDDGTSEGNRQRDSRSSRENSNDGGADKTRNSQKVKFSREVDSTGKQLTEAQQEYFKDSKVRDENGNLLVMYQGGDGEFTVFDRKKSKPSNLYGRGFYFTNSESHAKQYGNARAFYLNIKNPVPTDKTTITKPQLRKFLEVVAQNEDDYSFENYGYGATVDQVLQSIYGKSDFLMLYDIAQTAIGDMVEAVELFNQINGTTFDGLILDTETVTFRSNQAKSVDNKNPTPNPDIRFSRELPDTVEELQKENEELRKEYKELQKEYEKEHKRAEHFKAQTHLSKVKKARVEDVDRVTRKLLKEYESQADFGKVRNGLLSLANELLNAFDSKQKVDWNDVESRVSDIAQGIVDKAYRQTNGETLETIKEIRAHLRGTSIAIPEENKGDIPDFGDFKKRNFGNFIISDKGTPIDVKWLELQDQFGKGLFPEDIGNPSDQLLHLAELMGEEPAFSNPYSQEMTEATMACTNRILELLLYGAIRQETTFADRVKESHEAEKKRIVQYFAKERERANRERIEREKVAHNRQQVEKVAKSLMKMLAHPDKNNHVPMELQGPLMKFLESFDISTNSLEYGGYALVKDMSYIGAMMEMKQAVASQRTALDKAEEGIFVLDVPKEYIKRIDDHNKSITDAMEHVDLTTRRAYEMSSAELADLAFILNTISAAIHKIDNLHMQGAKGRVSELGKTTMREMKHRDAVKGESGNKLVWGNYTPYQAFRRMGTAAQQIFTGLTQGQGKLARTVKAAIDFAKKTYTEDQAKAWEKEVHSFELSSGETIQMTTAQVMGFWCLQQRKQAYKHMAHGGIRVGTFKSKGKDVVQTEHLRLSAEDIATISNALTKDQKDVARRLQQYMERVGGKLINEISMARWDYMAATEENYYPIKTDDATRDAKAPEQDTASLWALLNKSFTKELQPHAQNAIIIDSIFDVFADHMSETAEYNAFALPLVDAMKWFNYRERRYFDGGQPVAIEDFSDAALSEMQIEDISVQRSIRDTLGTAAVKYFTNLIVDINSAQKAGRHEDFLGKILSRAKVASVGWNLRVAIQQPTAILRASMLLDMPDLLRGSLRIGTKELVKEMQEYSGIALWKSMGYYDLNVSRSVRDQIKGTDSLVDRFNEKGLWLPAKMDEITWSRIWAACKLKVEREQGLSGERLKQETAKLFEDVVYQTQVADSVLTRSSWMRAKNHALREATAFLSEPTVSLNILFSAFQDYEEGHTTWEKAKRGLKIGFYGYTLSAIANALVTALMDAWRDDDEYESYGEKYLQALFGDNVWDGNLFSELNPVEKIAFAKDVISYFKGYTVQPGYAELYASAKSLIKNLDNIFKGKGSVTEYGVIYQALQLLSNAGGIALSNMTREVVGIWNNTAGRLYPHLLIHRYESTEKTKIRDAFKGQTLTEEEAVQALLQQGVYKDEDDAYWEVQKWTLGSDTSPYDDIHALVKTGGNITDAMNALIEHGYSEEQIRSNLKTNIGQWYKGTEDAPASISKSQAISMLDKYTDLSNDEIEALVLKWTCKVVTGTDYDDIKQELIDGKITAGRAAEMLVKYGSMEKAKAEAKVNHWLWQSKNPEYSDLSEAAVEKYTEVCQSAGVEVSVFYDCWKFYNSTEADKDRNGKPISGSKKNKVKKYIYGLDIPSSQKRLLMKCFYD